MLSVCYVNIRKALRTMPGQGTSSGSQGLCHYCCRSMELIVVGGEELRVQEFKILNANHGEAEATGPALHDL